MKVGRLSLRLFAFVTLLLFLASGAMRAIAADETKPGVIVLWPEGAPMAVGNAAEDVPRLTIYLPKKSSCQTAVVVIPGGAYRVLALDHEGKQPVQWLNSLGIAAFVLEYRLGSKYHY